MVYFRLGKCSELECRSGEIGRRTGFKILRGQPRVGSIPTSGTNYIKLKYDFKLYCRVCFK